MTTQTKSRILLTALILVGMSSSCYLFTVQAYVLYGVGLVIAGLGLETVAAAFSFEMVNV
jgi:hypothetical protein